MFFLWFQGTKYFEKLVEDLDEQSKVGIEDYAWGNGGPVKDTKTGTVLVVAQKVFLFLGHLARYREQACDTSNYFKARQ